MEFNYDYQFMYDSNDLNSSRPYIEDATLSVVVDYWEADGQLEFMPYFNGMYTSVDFAGLLTFTMSHDDYWFTAELKVYGDITAGLLEVVDYKVKNKTVHNFKTNKDVNSSDLTLDFKQAIKDYLIANQKVHVSGWPDLHEPCYDKRSLKNKFKD